jgi:hypothetical protein
MVGWGLHGDVLRHRADFVGWYGDRFAAHIVEARRPRCRGWQWNIFIESFNAYVHKYSGAGAGSRTQKAKFLAFCRHERSVSISLVRVRRVELLSQPWEGHIMAVIRHPHVQVYRPASFCRFGKSFDLTLRFSSQNSIQSLCSLDWNFGLGFKQMEPPAGIWPVAIYLRHMLGAEAPARAPCYRTAASLIRFVLGVITECVLLVLPEKHILEPPAGIEPATFSLRMRCSTN